MTLKLYELDPDTPSPLTFLTPPEGPRGKISPTQNLREAQCYDRLKEALEATEDDEAHLALIDETGAVYRIRGIEPATPLPPGIYLHALELAVLGPEDINLHARIADAMENAGDESTLGLADPPGNFYRIREMIPAGQLTKNELNHHLNWIFRSWGEAKGIAGQGKGTDTFALVQPAGGGPMQIHIHPHPPGPSRVQIHIDGKPVLKAAIHTTDGILAEISKERIEALQNAMKTGGEMTVHTQAEQSQTLHFSLQSAARAVELQQISQAADGLKKALRRVE